MKELKTILDKETILSNLEIESFFKREIPSIRWNNRSDWGQGLCFKHDDKNPSLFANKSTGQLHCKGCNYRASLFDFYMERHNVDFQTALQEIAKESGLTTGPKKSIVKTYDYVDESGNLLFQAVRYEPKDFKQRAPDGKDGWIWNLNGVRLVPYNLPEVLKAEDVIIVEGEKDVETLKGIGFTATCNPMGAGKWKPEYNEFFKGKKVVIIPDNDDPGKRHAQTVAKNLKDISESVKVVELPDLPEKGDISDWLALGHAKEELIAVIKQTPEWEEPKDNLSFLKKGSELLSLDCNIEWVVDRLIPKQSITLLHGKGGIGKTWISLIMANSVSKNVPFMDLTTQGMTVVFTDFENSLPVLVERVKKIGASEVLFWHNTNERRPPKLDREDWEQYKSLPIGLLIFDTLRASQSKDENSSQDMAFIMSRLKELRDMGFTIFLLHHTPAYT
jgi:5S rRNA maturation endonuclease (ribonuclease M5)